MKARNGTTRWIKQAFVAVALASALGANAQPLSAGDSFRAEDLSRKGIRWWNGISAMGAFFYVSPVRPERLDVNETLSYFVEQGYLQYTFSSSPQLVTARQSEIRVLNRKCQYDIREPFAKKDCYDKLMALLREEGGEVLKAKYFIMPLIANSPDYAFGKGEMRFRFNRLLRLRGMGRDSCDRDTACTDIAFAGSGQTNTYTVCARFKQADILGDVVAKVPEDAARAIASAFGGWSTPRGIVGLFEVTRPFTFPKNASKCEVSGQVVGDVNLRLRQLVWATDDKVIAESTAFAISPERR